MESLENSPSSRGLVAESSPENSSDGKRSVPSKSTLMPQVFLSLGKMTEFSHLSQSGMTSEHLRQKRIEELLMSYLEVFRVRTCRKRGKARVSRENEAGCGLRCAESLTKRVHDSSLSKTSKVSGQTASRRSGNHSLRSDTVAEAGTSMRRMSEHRIYASEHSFSRLGSGRHWTRRVTTSSSRMVEQQAARIAESVVHDAIALGHIPRTAGVLLTKVGELLPTPTVQDSENNAGRAQYLRNTYPLNVIAGGAMNPQWSEWIMGFPIGWTGLEPLEMHKFQQWLDLHGKSSIRR